MKDTESIEKIHSLYQRILTQVAQRIIGQTTVLEELTIALLAGGHCLLEGVPGLGKTLMVRTLAETLSLEFQRIQCTPDLMPTDITGSEMFQMPTGGNESATSTLHFVKGPVFTNILLADEINRTPPRTQSALLEAMQERQVTAGRKLFTLPQPFLVLATQNPIEQEGTYPLPEAQLDRFMFKSRVTYPTRSEELDILLQVTKADMLRQEAILTQEELLEAMQLVRRVPIATPVANYALDICRSTRPNQETAENQNPKLTEFIQEYVAWGAGPRAGLALLQGAQARAVLHGRLCVNRDDIRTLAPSVLRHRIQTRFSADAEGITTDQIVTKILELIPQ